MRTKNYYFKEMHARGRLYRFENRDGHIVGILGYVLTNNPEKILRSHDIWSLPPEDYDGEFIYLDRLATDRKSNIFRGLKDLIRYFSRHYPGKTIIWHSRKTGTLKEIRNENHSACFK